MAKIGTEGATGYLKLTQKLKLFSFSKAIGGNFIRAHKKFIHSF